MAKETQSIVKQTKLLKHLTWQCASCNVKHVPNTPVKFRTDFLPQQVGDEFCKQYWDKIVAPGTQRVCKDCT
eukprot:160249-Karenia_brevis.AAC.1